MARRPVRIWPDPVLGQRAREVKAITPATDALIVDMFDTMYAESGIGLAANQIGVPERVIVLDLDPQRRAGQDPELAAELRAWGFAAPLVLINPKIVAASGSVTWEEGCLSVPGINDHVKRRKNVTVQALDRQGKPQRLEAAGLFAVAIQHELDHINGKVFVEYLPRLRRDNIRRRMQRLRSGAAPAPAAADATAEPAL